MYVTLHTYSAPEFTPFSCSQPHVAAGVYCTGQSQVKVFLFFFLLKEHLLVTLFIESFIAFIYAWSKRFKSLTPWSLWWSPLSISTWVPCLPPLPTSSREARKLALTSGFLCSEVWWFDSVLVDERLERLWLKVSGDRCHCSCWELGMWCLDL